MESEGESNEEVLNEHVDELMVEEVTFDTITFNPATFDPVDMDNDVCMYDVEDVVEDAVDAVEIYGAMAKLREAAMFEITRHQTIKSPAVCFM